MSGPQAVTDLPERDPAVPRFAWAAIVLSITGALWAVVGPAAIGGPDGAGLPGQSAATTADTGPSGAAVFLRERCGTCHPTVGDSAVLGPSLEGIAARAEERVRAPDYGGGADTAQGYVREATLSHCTDVLPGYTWGSGCEGAPEIGLRLGAEEVDRLVAYVLGLGLGLGADGDG